MENNLFEELLTPTSKEIVERNLYNNWKTMDNMRTNVNNAVVGLDELMSALKFAHEAMEKNPALDYQWFDETKEKYDTIAYKLQNFIVEFKPLYEDVLNRCMAEKLSNEEKSDKAIQFADPVGMHGYIGGWDKAKLDRRNY